MSIFSWLAVVLGVFAGVINLVTGILNRDRATVMALRLVAALVSFAAPVVIVVAHLQGMPLVPTGWHNTVYLTLALAIFVGVTLMLPATIQRSLAPPPSPAPPAPPRPVTRNLTGEPGVRIAQPSDEWVN